MYATSAAYKTAAAAPVQESWITGTIGELSFTDENIAEGSFTIDNQCSDNKNVGIGQVYIGVLKATFRGINLAENEWYGKEIIPTFWLRTSPNTEEDVPLGVYTVSAVKKTLSGISVTAYDNMSKLDGRIDESVFSGSQTALTFANIIASRCGVQIGNTQAEMALLPNGSTQFELYSDNDLSTWRDAMASIAQAVCAFVTAGRDGKLYFRAYSNTTVATLDSSHRATDGAFSDFITQYSTIWFDNTEDGTETSYSSGSGGLTYEGGENPFLQKSVDISYEVMRQNIMDGLRNIQYSPFSVSVMPDPSYDLGDVISFPGGIAGKTCCITKYSFKHKKSLKLTGVGSDPSFTSGKDHAAKSISALRKDQARTNAQVTSVQSQVAVVQAQVEEISGSVMANYILPFGVSLDEITDLDRGGHPVNVLQFRISNDSDGNTATFYSELSFNVHTFEKDVDGLDCFQDAVVTVAYLYDNQVIQTAVYYMRDGWKILTLNAMIPQVTEGIHTFYVRMSVQGASLF